MKRKQIKQAKSITSPEFMPLLRKAGDDLSDYTIGFTKLLQNAKPPDIVIAGSGTLVTAAGVYAILTAEHVVANMPDSGPLGLVTPTRLKRPFNRLILDMQFVQKIPLGRRNKAKPRLGPDLALLVLPPTDASALATWKIFYNLSIRHDRMMRKPPPLNLGAWVLSGMVEERTKDLTPEKGYTRVKAFHGLCGPGVLAGKRRAGKFDYFSFETRYGEGYEGPDSFEGCSGGGLWHAILKERNGSVEISELLLAGVAFYQSPIIDGRRTIECHGRKSIYESVVKALERAARRS